MRSALLIPVDEAQPVHRIEVDRLASLQAAVGGDIEAIGHRFGERIAVYGDETAKYPYMDASSAEQRAEVLRETMNVRATRLIGEQLRAGDFIAGPLVVCGLDPASGEDADLPADFECHLEERRPLPAPDALQSDLARSRRVTFKWLLGGGRGTRGGERQRFAVLACSHHTAGANVLSGSSHANELYAALCNEDEDSANGTRRVTVGLFQGLRLTSEPVSRYSRRALDSFSQHALACLREAYGDSHPQVTRYFRVEETGGAL